MPLSKHFSARVLVATGNIPPYVLDYKGNIEDMLHHLYDLSMIIREDELLQPMIEQVLNERGLNKFRKGTILIPRLMIWFEDESPHRLFRRSLFTSP